MPHVPRTEGHLYREPGDRLWVPGQGRKPPPDNRAERRLSDRWVWLFIAGILLGSMVLGQVLAAGPGP